MSLRFSSYDLGYRMVSLALDCESKQRLESRGLPTLFVDLANSSIILLPENIVISHAETDIEKISEYNNFDILEIWENGFLTRIYNDYSTDNYFFITGKCNSNCIMCPSPELSRKNLPATDMEHLYELARHLPSDVRHMTITGGEPFLIGEEIFPFLQFLKETLDRTEFLFLTNGRIFAIDTYAQRFRDTMPKNSIVAIPIHGSRATVHDAITRVSGSFQQTVQGINHLIKYRIPVEIRIVVSKLNAADFSKIADLIIHRFPQIEYVSVIAMEMTGNARVNKELVWLPYSEAFALISPAIKTLMKNGIDVKLYNFPLCTVSRAFWTLCEMSISDNKVRFAEKCHLCRYRNVCSGVFAGTLSLVEDELEPIL